MEAHEFINKDLMYQKNTNFYLSLLNQILTIVLTFFVLSTVIFNIKYISTPVTGASMQPTLNVHGGDKKDIVYINRFSKISLGDIIVLNSKNGSDYLIKRVIAMEGDSIEITKENDGYFLYLNGKKLNEPYIYNSEQNPNDKGMENTYSRFMELKDGEYGKYFTGNTLTIQRGQVFVLGDHRGVSVDSSFYGPFDVNDVLGKVDHTIKYGTSRFGYFFKNFFNL